MSFEPLSKHQHRFDVSKHQHRFDVSKPTPYDIYDGTGRLLLARGHRFESQEQLEKLVDRDATVDVREFSDPSRDISKARPEQLPRYWEESMGAIGRLLRASPEGDFTDSLDRASRPLLALIARDPDLAILQAVRYESGGNSAAYASRHAVHAATAACLAATRLGWPADQAQCAMRAALTMNISMADLQNKLVNQASPVTPMQRAEIRSHPERSAAMLEMAGVTDRDWLDAVRQHHEEESGNGYPLGITQISEVAQLVRCADTFTAKLSPRLLRQPLLADKAARMQFQVGKGDVMTSALIKEFGLYPPGSAVRLKSGEVGMVMRRGSATNAPIVAVVTDRTGSPLAEPKLRDTGVAEHAIAAVIPLSGIKVKVGLEKLIVSVPK
jgi:HD-GYP domain-containing protein (c-di-GMP phosphodiesterase class II)